MRRLDPARLLRRSDARAVIAVGTFLLLALGLQGSALYAYVAMESLEEADRWMSHAVSVTRQLASKRPADATLLESVEASLADVSPALRILDPRGDVTGSRGAWPHPRRQIESGGDRDYGAFLLLRAENHLIGSLELASGETLEIALPLSHFAGETAEVGRGIALIVLFSGLAAMAIAVFATFRAFAPLRRATRLMHGVDARRLGRRLPSRHTGDPVDRHAETLNAVLASIDESFTRLRSFSSDAAHELRTPLHRIRSVAEVALLGGDDSDLRPALEGVQRSAEDLSGTVQSLLLLAELDDGRVPMRSEPLDVDAWLARTAETYEPLFEQAGLKLTVQSRVGSIEADRSLWDRVLLNLLDNALKHAASGDSVEVRGLRSEGWVTISVDDAGPGIPPEARGWIFDRFARLDGARGRTGSGLGLAVARAVARLQGGGLSVETSPLGGARFVWRLPIAPASSSKEEAGA